MSEQLPPIGVISVGIVAYNEQSALPHLLRDLVDQTFPHNRIEVLLIDGGSKDETRRIMEEFAASNANPGMGFARVAVIDNPRKIQAAGWNVAIQSYTGDALVRVDAHASIDDDFVENTVATLDGGEMVCGGFRPTVIEPGEETPWRQTLHVAEESAFGSSVASYRKDGEKRYVKSLFHGAYRREVIDRVGLFDERLLRTEDNDFHYRIGQAGYRILFNPAIQSRQFVRGSLSKMTKQKYGNGYWVGRTLFIQPGCLQLYHFAPFVFVLGIIAMLLTGLLVTWSPFAWCAGLYLGLCLVLTLKAVRDCDSPNATMALLPVVFFLIHFSYGVGTLVGILQGAARGKN